MFSFSLKTKDGQQSSEVWTISQTFKKILLHVHILWGIAIKYTRIFPFWGNVQVCEYEICRIVASL
jgi:hypothetical protein